MEELKTWNENKGILEKTFTFDNFVQALEFVNKVGDIAEKQNHHPDILIFSYNKVKISLTTHDEGNKITEKDITVAQKIDKI